MYINENIYKNTEKEGILKIKNKDKYYYVIFDLEDFLKISQYHWRLSKKKQKYYVCTGQNKNGGKIVYMHNLIMNVVPNKGFEIDHINGNSLNNKRDNLRLVSRIDNIHNATTRIDNRTTGIRGVSIDKRSGKYTVDFTYNKTRYYFKPFSNIGEAVYLRYLCEIKFLKNLRNKANDELIFKFINQLNEIDKKSIEEYFNEKTK